MACLEPRAELARQLEVEIAGLKANISRIRSENALLADTNEIQAKIIKSRSSSPVLSIHETPGTHEVTFHETVTHRSRSQSPCDRFSSYPYGNDRTVETTTVINHRSSSPSLDISRPFNNSPVGNFGHEANVRFMKVSSLSANHCTQVIRQDSLISRFNDLYSRDRMNAMDLLRHYSSFENNQRIIFAAVQV